MPTEGGRVKSFADVKRRMQPRVVLQVVANTRWPYLNGQLREVVKPQGNGAYCDVIAGPRVGERIHVTYPPATATRIVDADTFDMALRGEGGPIRPGEDYVRLRFVKDSEPAPGQVPPGPEMRQGAESHPPAHPAPVAPTKSEDAS
jgi:hypothetical protein